MKKVWQKVEPIGIHIEPLSGDPINGLPCYFFPSPFSCSDISFVPGPRRIPPNRSITIESGGVDALDVDDSRAVVGDDLRGVRTELVIVIGGHAAKMSEKEVRK